MSKNCKSSGEERSVYLTDKSTINRVRKIGHQLNKTGGIKAMLEVGNFIQEKTKIRDKIATLKSAGVTPENLTYVGMVLVTGSRNQYAR